MKAITFSEYGDSSVLEHVEIPVPYPAAGEVQIAVRAISVNPFDFKIRAGLVQFMVKAEFPATLSADAAGVVIGLGEGVTEFSVGDEVSCHLFGEMTATLSWGVTRQVICSPLKFVVPKPRTVDFGAAAAATAVAETAYQAILEHAQVTPGSTVLVIGAAGGVGSFATQLCANCFDCGKVLAVASPANRDFLIDECNATHFVNYREDIAPQIAEILGGPEEKVDFIVDCFGNGAVMQYAPFCKDTPESAIVTVADFTFQDAPEEWQRRFSRCMVRAEADHLRKIAEWIDAGKLKVFISHVFEWEDYDKAHDEVASGHARGKVVVNVPKWTQ